MDSGMMILTLKELRDSYVESKLKTDVGSDRLILENEFNRSVLRYLHLSIHNMKEFLEYGVANLVDLSPTARNGMLFTVGFLHGAEEQMKHDSEQPVVAVPNFED